MKAVQVTNSQSKPRLTEVEVPKPQPGKGELLIRVHAAGVTPTELSWYPTTHKKDGEPREHPIPGHEFSGVVAAIGPETSGFQTNQEVYGLNDWFAEGAMAEYCLAQPAEIALKPTRLNHEEAATVPIGALTAWQGLIGRAKVRPGERVLVHGGAGAVGIFAVQLAHLHGAHVISTASSRNRDFVAKLGAQEVIDYKTAGFEQTVRDIDVVFDTVGGETLERSWNVLKPSGRMVTVASGSAGNTDARVKEAFFIVEPKQDQLAEIAKLLDTGRLKTFINAVVPFALVPEAYLGETQQKRGFGKVVVKIIDHAA